jgi:hypothetical protein
MAQSRAGSDVRVVRAARLAGGSLQAAVVLGNAASVGCPTARISNGYIIHTIGQRGRYLPAHLWGHIATTTTASVCIKNVSGITQSLTACVATPLQLVPGATAALSGAVAGLYACDLLSNPNSMVLVHVI